MNEHSIKHSSNKLDDARDTQKTASISNELNAYDRSTTPKQEELILTARRSLIDLPTTKVKRPSRRDQSFSWAYTYTAFSLPFAKAAIEYLGCNTQSKIIDPFSGSGTSLIAASGLGCHSLGIDISPFSCLLARSRVAVCFDTNLVNTYLEGDNKIATEEADQSAISRSDMSYLRSVARKMGLNKNINEIWGNLLNDNLGNYDSEIVTIVSLCLAARDVTKLEKGSNPIWYRPSLSEKAEEGITLESTAKNYAKRIMDDLSTCSYATKPNIVNVDVRDYISNEKYDICLTSPPYLNRLDYVVAHIPELTVLNVFLKFSIPDLKSMMIGTTKINEKNYGEPPSVWGRYCNEVLKKIEAHSSYASRRYYYHTYRQYFSSLAEALAATISNLKANGKGLIVIQNSYYKDIAIDVPTICCEMLSHLGCESEVARTEYVKSHMGYMSPIQNSYAPNKKLGEALVYFEIKN